MAQMEAMRREMVEVPLSDPVEEAMPEEPEVAEIAGEEVKEEAPDVFIPPEEVDSELVELEAQYQKDITNAIPFQHPVESPMADLTTGRKRSKKKKGSKQKEEEKMAFIDVKSEICSCGGAGATDTWKCGCKSCFQCRGNLGGEEARGVECPTHAMAKKKQKRRKHPSKFKKYDKGIKAYFANELEEMEHTRVPVSLTPSQIYFLTQKKYSYTACLWRDWKEIMCLNYLISKNFTIRQLHEAGITMHILRHRFGVKTSSELCSLGLRMSDIYGPKAIWRLSDMSKVFEIHLGDFFNPNFKGARITYLRALIEPTESEIEEYMDSVEHLIKSTDVDTQGFKATYRYEVLRRCNTTHTTLQKIKPPDVTQDTETYYKRLLGLSDKLWLALEGAPEQ